MPKSTPPVGLATKTGLSAAALQFLVALLSYIGDGATSVTVTALSTSALTLITVLAGRYAQVVRAAAPLIEHELEGVLLHQSTPDEIADDEPGDPDQLPHLPTTETPAADRDDREHGR